MTADRASAWSRYCKYRCFTESLGLRLDISRMQFDDGFIAEMSEPMSAAFDAMLALEQGSIANVSEGRRVGHYWLRDAEAAPDKAIRSEVGNALESVRQFSNDVLNGIVCSPDGDGFFVVLVIGIGGSALGSQFLADALGGTGDAMIIRFLDNTDPDGFERVLEELDESLKATLVVVVSKSGSTQEVRNATEEVSSAFARRGLEFARHAVAVTQEGSSLFDRAASESWLKTFPIWEWVGGRTSVLSPAGLLPAALQGFDIDELLGGARDCDVVTRGREAARNPAALLALMWYYASERRGKRQMVVLPYRDRLAAFGRYLQQLVMESVGKSKLRDGSESPHGLTVYGNKGTTDQHAILQQLYEGCDDFFTLFVESATDRADPKQRPLIDGVTSGDYLHAFRLGTRDALDCAGRESISLSLDRIDARSIGSLIALFERAVGLYAELIDINAYDQPAVDRGKLAAQTVISTQKRVVDIVRDLAAPGKTAPDIAAQSGSKDQTELVYHILMHLAMNGGCVVDRAGGSDPEQCTFHRA